MFSRVCRLDLPTPLDLLMWFLSLLGLSANSGPPPLLSIQPKARMHNTTNHRETQQHKLTHSITENPTTGTPFLTHESEIKLSKPRTPAPFLRKGKCLHITGFTNPGSEPTQRRYQGWTSLSNTVLRVNAQHNNHTVTSKTGSSLYTRKTL